MKDALLAQLRRLEGEARPLEADAAQRRALAEAALAHAEGLIARLEAGPAVSRAAGAEAELPIGSDSLELARVLAWLDRNVDASGMNPASGRFFAYLPGGNLYESALADFLAAVSGRYSGRALAAPGAVRVENRVIRWFAELLGLPADSAGNVTSGGSLANLIAIVTAREAGGIRAQAIPRTVVYSTEQAHHSLAKGLRIAGLGETVQRRVPLDARFRMDAALLAELVAKDRAAGLAPWLVLATAGTTDTGAVDPLAEIASVAARERLWLHVDAAYGGMFALTDYGRRALAGIERADSVVVDPHKGMFLPWGVGVVLCRHVEAMRAAFAFEASYIPEWSTRQHEISPAEVSPELSRPFRALRVWLPLALLGTRPFAAALEEKLLLARYAHERIAALPGFEVGPAPDLSLFVFRALDAGGAHDALNVRLDDALFADGRVAISATSLGGRRWLRLAVLAARTHLREVDGAIAVLQETAARVRRE